MKKTLILFSLLISVLGYSPLMAGGKQAVFTGAVEQHPSIADLAEALSPTVVYIENKGKKAEMPNDPFHFFYNNQGERPPSPSVGAGSGVIVGPEGYIITNYHVVEDSSEITVTLNDERVFSAKIVGTDQEIDLAVLQIDAPDLVYAKFGESKALRVGDWVIAIGAPLGYRYTVTQGIISALNRGGSVRLNEIENYIQTDAAINRGNSGGPLINLQGQIIGINTAISAMGQNIGFAIPIDLIKGSYHQIIEKGSVSRGALGVQITSLSPEAKEFYGMTHGALVSSVTANSPAERAGIQTGDLITEIDGEQIKDSGHLVSKIAIRQPGDKIRVTRFRKGKTETLSLVLGDRSEIVAGSPMSREQNSSQPEQKDSLDLEAVGLSFKYLTEDQAWVISEVRPGSPAEEKGLRPGWKVLSINQTLLNKNDAKALFSNLNKSKDVLLIEIENSRGTQLFFLKPETK